MPWRAGERASFYSEGLSVHGEARAAGNAPGFHGQPEVA